MSTSCAWRLFAVLTVFTIWSFSAKAEAERAEKSADQIAKVTINLKKP